MRAAFSAAITLIAALRAVATSWQPAPPSQTLRPTCSVLEFGAVGDNRTEATAAVLAAIAACSTVVFPAPGAFLLRPIKLDAHDNLTLVVEPGATLVAWPDPDTWNANATRFTYPLLWSDGYRPCAAPGPYAFALCPAPLAGFTLTGGGTIDGQGWRWWPFLKTRPRPILVDLSRAERLLIDNVTLLDSPSFHIQIRGSDMEVARVTIRAGGCKGWASAPNTDGINIGGQRIHVHDSSVHNGDDCVPTNGGWNGTDTDGVLVERVHCECGTNGGVPIIAGAASIRNVVYRDMSVLNSNQGAGAKISEAYDAPTGAFVNISWRNVSIVSPRYAAIYTNVFQEDSQPRQCMVPVNASRPTAWLTAHNFSFSGIAVTLNSTTGAYGGCFVCAPSAPCDGFSFEDVVVTDVAAPAAIEAQAVPADYVCENVRYGADAASLPRPCGS